MRETLLLAIIALSACAQNEATPLEICLHDSNDGWSEIPPPQTRVALFGLPFTDLEGKYRAVRDDLRAADGEKEAWFQDNKGKLLVCVYHETARKPCDAWPRGFEFQLTDSRWEARKFHPFCLQ